MLTAKPPGHEHHTRVSAFVSELFDGRVLGGPVPGMRTLGRVKLQENHPGWVPVAFDMLGRPGEHHATAVWLQRCAKRGRVLVASSGVTPVDIGDEVCRHGLMIWRRAHEACVACRRGPSQSAHSTSASTLPQVCEELTVEQWDRMLS